VRDVCDFYLEADHVFVAFGSEKINADDFRISDVG